MTLKWVQYTSTLKISRFLPAEHSFTDFVDGLKFVEVDDYRVLITMVHDTSQVNWSHGEGSTQQEAEARESPSRVPLRHDSVVDNETRQQDSFRSPDAVATDKRNEIPTTFSAGSSFEPALSSNAQAAEPKYTPWSAFSTHSSRQETRPWKTTLIRFGPLSGIFCASFFRS